MQVKKIAALCALAFAGATQAAVPGAAGDLTTAFGVIKQAREAGRIFYISGASATQSGLNQISASLFTGTTYRLANTTASSKDYEAVAGVLGSVGSAWDGQTVIVVDRVKGGSVMGVNPVARNEAIEMLVVDENSCNGSGVSPGSASNPFVCGLTNGGTIPHIVPDAGVSDVAPNKFKNPYNTEGETPAAALDEIEIAEFADPNFNGPLYTLAFGVPVTNNISPTLTRATVAGIMQGTITNWSSTGIAAGDIVVCRRVQGSGTQAVYNLHFGNFPCSEALALPPADRDATSAWNDATNTYTITATSGYQVIENSTSGDVRNCLTTAANPAGGSYVTKDRDGNSVTVNFAPKAGGHKAIGVLSMDSLTSSNATSANGWSFRTLDGIGRIGCADVAGCPTDTSLATVTGTGRHSLKSNLETGAWEMQGWISWNVPVRTSTDPVKGSFAQAFKTAAQKPTTVSGQNSLKNVALALPAPFNGDPLISSGILGDQITEATYPAGNGDQCGPLVR